MFWTWGNGYPAAAGATSSFSNRLVKKGEFAVDATAPLAYTSAMPANSQPLSRRRALQFAGIGILVLSTIPALRRPRTIWPLVAPQIVVSPQ